MKNLDDNSRHKIVLSVQRALLGSITPNLRGVAVDWNDNEIRVFCYYHGAISEDDREEMSCVHTEVATDFVDIAAVHFVLVRSDMPTPMKGYRAWIFLRKETVPPENSIRTP